jgi:ATP-dependent Lon protease
LLDEVDKIAHRSGGNLQDVIMELLDPVQNKKFKD